MPFGHQFVTSFSLIGNVLAFRFIQITFILISHRCNSKVIKALEYVNIHIIIDIPLWKSDARPFIQLFFRYLFFAAVNQDSPMNFDMSIFTYIVLPLVPFISVASIGAVSCNIQASKFLNDRVDNLVTLILFWKVIIQLLFPINYTYITRRVELHCYKRHTIFWFWITSIHP